VNREKTRSLEEIRSEIEQRMGFVPPLFDPADEPPLLEHLWQEAKHAYLDNPLPRLFKEELFAYLSRFCGVPYPIVAHSCALRPLGLEAGEILDLLERGGPAEGLSPEFFAALEATPGPLESWPGRGSEMERTIFTLATAVFVEPVEVGRAKRELRRILGERLYSHLTIFLSHVWSCHLWLEAHPELSYERDQRVRDNLGPLLEAEPRLGEFFRSYRERAISEDADRARALTGYLEASEDRYRALIETAGDAIISADADGRIISFNRAAERMFGRTAAEAIGEPLTVLMPERFHSTSLTALDTEIAGLRRDGTEFPLEISLAAWRSAGRGYFTGVLRDVTERRRVERDLREATERFEGAFSHAAIGMALVAPDGSFLQVNDSLCAIVGYSREQLLARSFQDITHPDDLNADLEHVRRVLAGEIETYDMEKRYLHASGEVVSALLSASLVRDAAGQPLHFVSQIQDITDRKRIEEELRALANSDDLTGLANRRRFMEELERHVDRGARYGWTGALLALDLDRLKPINDTLGHGAGDQLIRHAAGRLRQRLRTTDFLARLGGDEFAVLLPEADADAARTTAHSLVEELAGQEVSVGGVRAATASIGVALITEPTTAEELLIRADLALYEAKDAGGNRFAFYDPQLDGRFADQPPDASPPAW
jgi:diguanylate cyclase (GGDEF)-like protein/PAS domain S-box-containing protein